MKSINEFLTELKANDKILAAIAQGEFKKDTMSLILKDVDKIFKKYAKGSDWTYHDDQFNDRGVTWNGDDMKAAEKVVANITGDLYDYFNKTSQKKKPRVKKINSAPGHTYYEVSGWNDKDKKYEKSQITFFRKDKFNKGDAVVGFLTSPK